MVLRSVPWSRSQVPTALPAGDVGCGDPQPTRLHQPAGPDLIPGRPRSHGANRGSNPRGDATDSTSEWMRSGTQVSGTAGNSAGDQPVRPTRPPVTLADISCDSKRRRHAGMLCLSVKSKAHWDCHRAALLSRHGQTAAESQPGAATRRCARGDQASPSRGGLCPAPGERLLRLAQARSARSGLGTRAPGVPL
jgi:hypothetical protein